MALRTFFGFQLRERYFACGRRAQLPVDPSQPRERAGFWDASLWEAAKLQGGDAIKALIESGLKNTSVTAVLIGADTAARKWVIHETQQSYACGNGILGTCIHNVLWNGRPDLKGANSFDQLYIEQGGRQVYLSSLYRAYDWIIDSGYHNIGQWIETATGTVGR